MVTKEQQKNYLIKSAINTFNKSDLIKSRTELRLNVQVICYLLLLFKRNMPFIMNTLI